MEKVQTTIGQRLKFLMEHFGLSARNFSRALEVPDNNTQNYIGPKPALPKADYLEKVLHHFKSVSPAWLMTGEGEPFLPESGQAAEPNTAYTKNNYGNSVGINKGTNTQHKGGRFNIQFEGPNDLAMLQELVEQLKAQLADKERTIQILLGQQAKP